MKRITKYLPLISLIIFGLIYYWTILDAPFRHDTYKLMTANQGPLSYNWKYWLYIFTHPNHVLTQYRPLSYFVYPFITHSLFGLNAIYYHIAAFGLFTSIIWAFYILLKRLGFTLIACFLASIFFILYPGHHHLLDDISNNFKYYFPLLILIITINICHNEEKIKVKKLFFIMALLTISIMSHEGSCVFSIVLLLIRFSRGIFSAKEGVIIVAPSLLYGVMRLFVFEIPTSGFMSIKISGAPLMMSRYIDYMLSATFLTIPIVVTLIISTVYITTKEKRSTALCYLISIWMLLLPFSLLNRGSELLDRSVFAMVPLALLFAKTTTFFKKYERYIFIGGMIFLCISAYKFKLISLEYSKYEQHRSADNNLREQINKNIKGIKKDDLIQIKIKPVFPKRNEINHSIVPGLLALSFPTRSIIFSSVTKKGSKYIYIKNGFPYYSYDMKGWTDTFGYPYSFTPPSIAHVFEVDISDLYRANYFKVYN